MEAVPENRSRLFWLSVLALFTAAARAALRAAVASSLKTQWIDPIAPVEAGELIGSALGSAFLGFAATLFVASALLDRIGARQMLIGCGLCFLVGTAAIIGAGSDVLAQAIEAKRAALHPSAPPAEKEPVVTRMLSADELSGTVEITDDMLVLGELEELPAPGDEEAALAFVMAMAARAAVEPEEDQEMAEQTASRSTTRR